MVAVFFWCSAYDFFKSLCEVIHVWNPAALCNRLDLHMGGIEQEDAVFYPLAVYIFGQCGSGFFFEKCGQVAGVYFQKICLCFQAQVGCQVGINAY